MQSIDIYEMIEVLMDQPPFNLPATHGEHVPFWTELVRYVPTNVMGQALRDIAAYHKLRLDDDEAEGEDYDDSMDGDFDSAMASAGFGTDEDYGCYGGDEW
jgi:hypothetical protein